MKVDFSIYLAHVGFWGAFGTTRFVLARRRKDPRAVAAAPAAKEALTAPFSRALLAFHMFGFAVMYMGIANAVFPRRIPVGVPHQRLFGLFVIVVGAVIANWALLFFNSWRFRAKLEEGHQLATGGPFRYFRHPIYFGLTLLALGSAVWIPTPIVWIGFLLMAIGSDLRGRSEEKLLIQAFSATYRDYCAHTYRFLPGVY